MSKKPSLLQQFRSFCFQNNPNNIEDALKYFAVFGGTSWSVDMTKPLSELIESKILKNYTYINGDITKFTKSDKVSHSLLSAVAIGDGRVHSALKRARISRGEGEEAIDTLCDKGIIKAEYSLESPPSPDEKIDEKLNFSTPFMRFWFAFISPFFKTIKEGDYKEAKERFANREQEFSELLFLKLSHELLKKSFKEDPIVEIGSYWDRNIQIDILAKTASGKIVAGVCKYSNSKAKKSSLTKLQELCDLAELTPDICVIISKGGFSNELKTLKGEDVKLFALKSFKTLVEDLSEKDFIECEGKKY
ncbi:MAG: ATPase [Sulfurimonas sp. RIFOXYD12_FULL_36_11]|nr:MAG: ATPase [Sulfurimonas sp. RIFOXYD12_FULL_36_11]